MTFAAIGGGIASAAVGGLMGGSNGKTGGSNAYSPAGLDNADTGWQNMFNQQQQNAQQGQNQTQGLYQQTLNAQVGSYPQQQQQMQPQSSWMAQPMQPQMPPPNQAQVNQAGGWASNQDGGQGNMLYNQQQAANQAAQQPQQQQMQQQQAPQGQRTGGINYDPMQQSANQAGQQYQGVANLAGQQAQQYGQQAGLAGQQQQNMYNAGNQVMNTAFDPQQALYNRTQQQLGDQINVGQAQRGLGNSAVGGSEYNQGMSNFNIDWQNAQLQRQAQGIQSGAQASNAGGNQGQLMGANMAAQMGSAASQPGYTQQAGNTGINAQQYIAGQPAAAANQYLQGMQNQNSMMGNVAGQAIPYMNQGVGAQQAQQMNDAKMNAGVANNAGQIGSQVGSWLGNLNWNKGTPTGQAALSGQDQSSIWSANGYGGGV